MVYININLTTYYRESRYMDPCRKIINFKKTFIKQKESKISNSQDMNMKP